MKAKPTIKCNCGQRIRAKDVMQTGYYLRLFGPSFVYVKYRCSRCKKLGEQCIRQEEWDDAILNDAPVEMSEFERRKFQAMGKIDIREAVKFHFDLNRPDALARLNKEISNEPVVETE